MTKKEEHKHIKMMLKEEDKYYIGIGKKRENSPVVKRGKRIWNSLNICPYE